MTNQPKATDRESSELECIFQELSSQNSILISTIQQLEDVGHKIKNTNYPTEAKTDTEKAKPDGLLQDIGSQLLYFKFHNQRLMELYKKLSSLL